MSNVLMYDLDIKRNFSYVSIGVFIFLLASINFFSPVFIDIATIKAVSWLVFCFYFIFLFKAVFLKRSRYSIYSSFVRGFIGLFFLAAVTAFFSHSQGFSFGVRAILPFFSILIFFIFYQFCFSVNDVERFVVAMFVFYCIMFAIALYFAPRVIFDSSGGNLDEFNTSRGVVRVKVPGVEFVYLSFFIFLNRLFLRFKFSDFALATLGFVVILLNVSRQHIFFGILLASFFLLRNVKWYYVLPVVTLISLSLYLLLTNVEIIQRLVSLTQEQIQDTGVDNIRILGYRFFFSENLSNLNLPNFLFGNGVPHYGSRWGGEFLYFQEMNGFFLSDIGFAKLFYYFGLTGCVLVIFLVARIARQPVPPRAVYIKYYLSFIFFTNIGSHSFFTDIVCIGIALYILDFFNLIQVSKNKLY